MNIFNLSRGKIPLIPVTLALITALLLDFIPLPISSFFWLPKFSAMVLIFLSLHRAETFGLFFAFILGLIVDAGTATPLGQHALAYVISIFILQYPAFMQNMNTPMRQIIGVCVGLLTIQAILLFVSALSQRQLSHPEILFGAVSGTLLWPLVDKVLKNLFARLTR